MRGEIFAKVMVFTMGAFLVGTQLVNLINFVNGIQPTMNLYEMGLWWTIFLMGALLLQSPAVNRALSAKPVARPARKKRR
ncbi:MAG: hypothetical protein ABH803_02810 [Candidatus Micrarchaeota archaeon]